MDPNTLAMMMQGLPPWLQQAGPPPSQQQLANAPQASPVAQGPQPGWTGGLTPQQMGIPPLVQALQPRQAAPVQPGMAAAAQQVASPLAAAGDTAMTKIMPWLAAAQFISQASSQPVTFGGGRGGGFSTSGTGLL